MKKVLHLQINLIVKLFFHLNLFLLPLRSLLGSLPLSSHGCCCFHTPLFPFPLITSISPLLFSLSLSHTHIHTYLHSLLPHVKFRLWHWKLGSTKFASLRVCGFVACYMYVCVHFFLFSIFFVLFFQFAMQKTRKTTSDYSSKISN